jgi:transcription elongation factor Elf1
MATQQQIVNALLGKPVDPPEHSTRGMTLPCPHCGEEQAVISLNLADMDSFTCQECNAEFDTDSVRNLIAKWTRILAWIGTAPGSDE